MILLWFVFTFLSVQISRNKHFELRYNFEEWFFLLKPNSTVFFYLKNTKEAELKFICKYFENTYDAMNCKYIKYRYKL